MPFKKDSIIIILFLLIFSFISSGKDDLFKFEYVEFQNEVTIKKNSKNNVNVRLKTRYQYNGEDVVDLGVAYYLYVGLCGKIIYLNERDEKIFSIPDEGRSGFLNVGSPYFKFGNSYVTLFKKNEIYYIETELINPEYMPTRDETKIKAAIRKKEITKIFVRIEKGILEWEKVKESKRYKKKRFEFSVNKTIEIKVKYESDKNSKSNLK